MLRNPGVCHVTAFKWFIGKHVDSTPPNQWYLSVCDFRPWSLLYSHSQIAYEHICEWAAMSGSFIHQITCWPACFHSCGHCLACGQILDGLCDCSSSVLLLDIVADPVLGSVIYMLMLLQYLYAQVPCVWPFESDDSSVVSTSWVRWKPWAMNLPTTKCQAGISALRRLQSHFDGDWVSKALEAEGAAYGHWPVSSQLVVLSTKPDMQIIKALDRDGPTMTFLKPLICLCLLEYCSCFLSSWDRPGLIVLWVFCFPVRQMYGLLIPWQFDKSSLVAVPRWDKGDRSWVLSSFYSVL